MEDGQTLFYRIFPATAGGIEFPGSKQKKPRWKQTFFLH